MRSRTTLQLIVYPDGQRIVVHVGEATENESQTGSSIWLVPEPLAWIDVINPSVFVDRYMKDPISIHFSPNCQSENLLLRHRISP